MSRIFSPFTASLFVGSIYSVIIKEYTGKEFLYIKRQNEDIIKRLKELNKD
jgi:hypothetical protein